MIIKVAAAQIPSNHGTFGFGGNGSAVFNYPRVFGDSPALPVDSLQYRIVKRLVDIFCAAVLLAVFAIPGLVIAVLILLTSRGPLFYREQRIGRDGVPFRIWKFRTMHRDAALRSNVSGEGADTRLLQWRMCKNIPDPRITALGCYLRSWSLDEIPQLLNVLRGEMSLIGPRPIVRSEVALYGDLLKFYMTSLPGISGIWQVSGRSDLDYGQRAELDAFYVCHWSLWRDICILARTIPTVLGRTGAH